MDEVKNEDEYLTYFVHENKIFDLSKFMLNDDVVMDNGACILITPNQLISTRNIPSNNSKPGSGMHDDTNYYLTSALYETDLNRNIYIREKQNILIRMINEGKDIIHIKGVSIDLPNTITLSQLEFLNYLEDNYGEVLTTISNKMMKYGELPLILFRNKDNKDIFCKSFKELIEYAKNNLLDINKEIIEEKNIIGLTLEDIRNKNKNI